MQDQSILHKMAGKSGEKNMQTAHVQCILPVQRESDNRTLGFTISSTSATKNLARHDDDDVIMWLAEGPRI